MLVVAELNGSGDQISEGSVTDLLTKPTIIHTDIFRHQVRDFKPHFLGPQRSELKNFSAYQQENFLSYLKLTLSLFLEQLLRELWLFQTWETFFWDTLYVYI